MAYPQQYLGDAKSYLPTSIHSFLFVRHGLTDWNALHYAQGSTDIPLNTTGEHQALNLRAALLTQKRAGAINLVVSSPLSRARKTAELATEDLDVEIVDEDGLRERGMGMYEGTVPEVKVYRGDYGDAEVTEVFSRRVARALGRHCMEEGRLIVAHGGVLRVILALLETDVEEELLGNARVLRFQRDGGRWKVTEIASNGG